MSSAAASAHVAAAAAAAAALSCTGECQLPDVATSQDPAPAKENLMSASIAGAHLTKGAAEKRGVCDGRRTTRIWRLPVGLLLD
eukprot:scaffold2200_cov413-Prasinococcus_capsulatus_cf.AAC.23